MMSSATAERPRSDSPQPALVALLLALIVLVNVAGSTWWIQRNVVSVGRDATAYLDKSFEYFEFLQTLSPQTVFQVFTSPEYRTPAIYIAAQPFLRVFGTTQDGAQYANVFFLALLVVLTWALGRAVTGPWTAIFGALIVGLLPMSSAMARLFYTEAMLAAAVTLNLLALYRCDGFRVRGWSIVWGVSLGLGLLVKWTMPIYIALPLIWLLWRSSAGFDLDGLWRPRSALIALLPALLVPALWLLPNRDIAAAYAPIGWLFAGWFVLTWLAVYPLLLKSTAATNLWASLALAALVASLWYLPHYDFPVTLFATDVERGSGPIGATSIRSWTRYLTYAYEYHFGRLAFWVVVPAALCPWIYARLWRRRSLNSSAVLLWMSLLSGYLTLVLLSQSNARNLVPLLSPVAVLIAIGIAGYPAPWRTIVGAIAVIVLGLQWIFLTVDLPGNLYLRAQPLLTIPHYSVPPASDETDPAWWVAPQILSAVATPDSGVQSLTTLVNADYLHRGILRNLIAAERLPIRLRDATEEDASWETVLSSQWVLVKDGNNKDVEEAGLALIDRITAGDPLFEAVYEPEKTFQLPNEERVTLYHRRAGPGLPEIDLEQDATARSAAEFIGANWSGSATLLYAAADPAIWVGRLDPSRERVSLLASDPDDAIRHAQELTGTVFVVLDPSANEVEGWLNQNTFKAAEVGNDALWVAVYGLPEDAPEQHGEIVDWMPKAAEGNDGQVHSLASVSTWATATPGEVLPVELAAQGEMDGRKWSVRLEDGSGQAVAANDRPVLPFDRIGLLVPPDTVAGEYALTVRSYDGASLEPHVSVADGSDVVTVATVRISASTP